MSEGTILTCVGGATMTTYITKISQKQPVTIQPLIGMFAAGALLLIIDLAAPDIATGFAILLLVTALLLNGSVLFGTVTKLTGGTQTTGH